MAAVKTLQRKFFRGFRDLAKKLKKANEAWGKWVEEKCDELDCYPDDWQPRVGRIVKRDLVNKEITAVEKVDIAITREARKRDDARQQAAETLSLFAERVADVYSVVPGVIDFQKGTIGEHSKEQANQDIDLREFGLEANKEKADAGKQPEE